MTSLRCFAKRPLTIAARGVAPRRSRHVSRAGAVCKGPKPDELSADVSFSDLGPDFYDKRINASHQMRSHITQFEALCYKVTPRTRRLNRTTATQQQPEQVPKGHALLLRARRSKFRFPIDPPGIPPLLSQRGRRKSLMQEPEDIADGEYEQVVARVAAVDVAKASGMVCTRVPHASIAGRRVTKVWQVSATTNAILELADHLAGQGIERIVVESTSDYWRPFLYLLQGCGLTVWLVNRQRRQERPRQAHDGQARRGVAGETD
jgi:hypothetical protein